jgi:hypothetical protein
MGIEIGDRCKRGHEITGDNIQYYINQGKQRVRCSQCNQPPRSSLRAKKPGDVCKRGHLIDGENLGMKSFAERTQYFCKECRRESVRSHANRKSNYVDLAEQDRLERNRQRAQSQAGKRAADRADEMISAGKEEKALNYLQLNRRAERASDALQKAMLKNKAKCAKNPGPYMDYDENDPPSKSRAYALCVDCPVLVECARFASASKPAIGVWGGEVYQEGTLLY